MTRQSKFRLLHHDNSSCVSACTTRLNGLDLSLRPAQPLEALRQLGAVKEVALACLNGPERGSRRATDGARGESIGLIEGAVLLSFLAIACKGFRKGVGGGSRVRLGGVVDLCKMLVTGATEL